MARLFLIILVCGAIALGIAVFVIGAFPPQPHQQPVTHTVPTDRFQPHQ